MPQYVRAAKPGGTYFFTLVTYQPRPFHAEALCLLPDHLHCILTLPEDNDNYSLRWRRMKGIFSRLYRIEANIEEIPLSLSRVRIDGAASRTLRYYGHNIRQQTLQTRGLS